MKTWYTFAWALMLLLVVSCQHDELCFHHPHDARLRIDVDWSKFVEEVPTGMSVMVFPQDDGAGEAITKLTNTTTHAVFSLPAGRYHSLVYNQSPSEYGSISFRGMDQYETAEVYANPTDSRWYVSRGDEPSRVVTEPEWIGTGRLENLVVTPEMVENTAQEDWAEQVVYSRARVEKSILLGKHTPLNIIYTITVRVHIEGIYNLRSARASLSGLAEGYWLGKGKTTVNKVIQLMEDWKLTINPDDPTRGTIETQIACFGLPDGHRGTAEENELMLSLLLVDNKTKLDFPFYVGDDFEAHMEEDIHLTQSLALQVDITIPERLPDVKPEGYTGGGGFDAKVEDWGEEQQIEIPM